MGIQTFFPDGSLMFDSDAVAGGVCCGCYEVAAGASFYKEFPLLQGAQLRVSVSMYSSTTYGTTTSSVSVNNSGVPSVSVSPIAVRRLILVWATGTPSIMSGAGMQAVSAGQTIALSPAARGLNYLGIASYLQLTPTQAPDWDVGNWLVQISSPTPPVGVVDMSGGIYLMRTPTFARVSGDVWQAKVVACGDRGLYKPSTSILQPTIHCFATPANPSASPAAALYDVDGTLAFDLLAGKLLTSISEFSASSSEMMAGADLSVQRSLPAASKYGLWGGANYVESARIGGSSMHWYQGAFQISGSTLSLVSAVSTWDGEGYSSPSDLYRRAGGAYAEVIDLTGY